MAKSIFRKYDNVQDARERLAQLANERSSAQSAVDELRNKIRLIDKESINILKQIHRLGGVTGS